MTRRRASALDEFRRKVWVWMVGPGHWRVGYWRRDIKKGKRKGWHVVQVSALRDDGRWKWRRVTVRPTAIRMMADRRRKVVNG